MRIDAYSAINQIQSTSKISKSSNADKVTVTDKLEISQAGRDYQIAKKAVNESPDIRQDLVDSIKSRINNGTYNVSDDDVADKILASVMG